MRMKSLLAAAASVCLILGAAAAEEQHHDRGAGPNNTTTQNGGNPGQGNGAGGHMDRGHQGNGGAMNGGAMSGGAMSGGAMNQGNAHALHPNNMMMQRGPTSVHRNFDVQRYQRTFNAQRRFHVGVWQPPQGYAYQRWTYGQRLPGLYFGRNYWLTNFAFFGLMPPPPNCVWVRYGPDALLVDQYTGEIIQVSYGVFY
jgi:Ni/Co efflux regulator RcnB